MKTLERKPVLAKDYKIDVVVPLGDRVLVKRAEAEAQSPGGVLIPEVAKDKPKEGRVMAVGDGKQLENGQRSTFAVKVGDRVVFSAYAGTEIKHAGEDLLIMREEDILGIVRTVNR